MEKLIQLYAKLLVAPFRLLIWLLFGNTLGWTCIIFFVILLVFNLIRYSGKITSDIVDNMIYQSFCLGLTTYIISKIISLKESIGERHKRGALFISEKKFKRRVKKYSRLHFSRYISIPQDAETRHFFICGTTGTGKTALISQVIEQLKELNQKIILYDAKDGEFVARFYNSETDVIYNPFDARSIYWNVFEAIKDDNDFDALAKSVIPESYGRDQFFINASRDALSGIFRYCYINGKTDNAYVWEILKQPDKIYEILCSIKHESANTIRKDTAGGQTQGVLSTLMQYAKIFRYLGNTQNKEPFPLTEWIQDENQKGVLFLPNNTKQQASLKGIISLFLNTVSDSILSLPDKDRRIFIIVDEFGDLQRLHSIEKLLSKGRSKGCSFWIGIQEKAQIDKEYGEHSSRSIINQCNTQLIFRLNDSKSAEYFSKNFGEREYGYNEKTYNEGKSDQNNPGSWGRLSSESTSSRHVTKTDMLILPSQFQGLPDLHFYAKVPNFPAVKSNIEYKSYDIVNEAFVPDDAYQLTPYKPKESAPEEKNDINEVKDENEEKSPQKNEETEQEKQKVKEGYPTDEEKRNKEKPIQNSEEETKEEKRKANPNDVWGDLFSDI